MADAGFILPIWECSQYIATLLPNFPLNTNAEISRLAGRIAPRDGVLVILRHGGVRNFKSISEPFTPPGNITKMQGSEMLIIQPENSIKWCPQGTGLAHMTVPP